jgi:hypothetical protein
MIPLTHNSSFAISSIQPIKTVKIEQIPKIIIIYE